MTHKIIDSSSTEFMTSEAGDTWTLKLGSKIDTANIGIFQNYADTVLHINGSVEGTDIGILNQGPQ
jgi:hypothetical protein